MLNFIQYYLPVSCFASLIGVCGAQENWKNLITVDFKSTALSDKTLLEKIDGNPLKGLIPTFPIVNRTAIPFSIERRYIDLKDIFDNPDGNIIEAPINAQLNGITANGCHAVLRVICDYPGNNQFKVPASWNIPTKSFPKRSNGNFVYVDGVQQFDYTLDWNYPALIANLEKFIAKFGEKYNNDPRIVMIEVGLYGFWGEWHTSPATGQQDGNSGYYHPDLQMTLANRKKLITAYQNAFPNKFIAMRNPVDLLPTTATVKTGIEPLLNTMGFYDDSFSHHTIGNAGNRAGETWATWNTCQALYNAGTLVEQNYKNFPRGGEFKPETASGINTANETFDRNNLSDIRKTNGVLMTWPNHSKDNTQLGIQGVDEDFEKSVNAFRPSWMGAQGVFDVGAKPTTDELQNARYAIRRLGYSLQVNKASLVKTGNSSALVKVEIENKGVAPFYFNWDVEFATMDQTQRSLGTHSGWNVKGILPGLKQEFTATLSTLPDGNFPILMRMVNPLPGGNGKLLRFYNNEQDSTSAGWLTLGTLSSSDGEMLSRSGWVPSTFPNSGGSTLAIDGDMSTRWSTGTPQVDGQWFQVDMQVPQTFDQIELNTSSSPGDYPRGYKVEVSNDGVNWGSSVTNGNGSGSVVKINFPTQTARFIRVTQTGSVPGLWWSIHEFNVYRPATNLLSRSGWTSSTVPNNADSNSAIDNDMNSRWSTGAPQVDGQSFTVDMQVAKTFYQIELNTSLSPDDYPRGYRVQVSNDGTDWGSSVATGNGSSSAFKINFPTQTARFIRVTQTGSVAHYWWSIYDFNVYGAESPGIQWTQTSIGTSVGGSASQADSTWTIHGSGTDIYNSPDSFYYVHQASDGDCSIVARVESLINYSSGWARAGIMIREGTGVDDRYAMVCVTPGNGVRFQCRTVTGGGSSLGVLHSSATNGYVRIVRSGNVFTANYSADGNSWPTAHLQSVTFPSSMPNTTKSGLIVCNHSSSTAPALGTFSEVIVTP